MDVRTRTGSYLCLLVAVLATGCETLRGTRADRVGAPAPAGAPRPDPAQPTQPWPAPQAPAAPAPGAPTQLPPVSPAPGDATQSEGIGGGLVVAASGANPVGTPVGTSSNAQPPAQPPGAPLAPPRAVTQNGPGAGAPNGQPPTMLPPVGPSGSAAVGVRVAPTATGGIWGLNQYETPAEKLLELTNNLKSALDQNRDLLARIKELEALGTGREQALAEAARELDAVNAQAARTRTALEAQVNALQNKIADLEDEQIAFLREAIKVLERRAPLGGK